MRAGHHRAGHSGAAWLALAGCVAVPAIAVADVSDAVRWHLPDGATQVAIADRTTLYGIPADIVYYEAPLAVAGMIAHFAAHHPALRDLAVLPGMVVLSDRSGECMRTATVAGIGPTRSAGTLSRVCWPAETAAAPAPPAWLPAGARLAFDFGVHDTPASYVQQVWRHDDAPEAVRTALRRALVRHGWTPLPPGMPAGEPAREWRRGAQLLAIDTVAAEPGSAIVLRLQDPPTAAASGGGAR